MEPYPLRLPGLICQSELNVLPKEYLKKCEEARIAKLKRDAKYV
jgi:hypothetical protein